ncbi:MAG: NADPH-dependent FMN reductase [Candidatus Rokuibacteriota bacterium]
MSMPRPRIVAFAGSLRKASYNRRLLPYAADGAREAGADVEEVGPEALALPLYDGDLEVDGRFPEPVERWRQTIRRCDGLLIASPEYNHGMSGVLKNAIDWASRPPNAFSGKVAASFGASPGAQGTARSQMNVRQCLGALNVWVVPRTVLVAHARDAFEGDALRDQRQAQSLTALGRMVVEAVGTGIGRLVAP